MTPETLYVHVGENIQKARLSRHLSYAELSKLLGISPASLRHIESGKQRITAHLLFQLSSLFGFAIDSFFAELQIPQAHDDLHTALGRVIADFSEEQMQFMLGTAQTVKRLGYRTEAQ